jgi:tRNA pseudouridine65 synthase
MNNRQIELLWQDKYIGLINKPANLIIHRTEISSDRDTLVRRLQEQFENPPVPVHRLDRPVSGLLMGAFDTETASALSRSFREGEMDKRYIAIVRGIPEESGEITIALKNSRTLEMQESRTTYRKLASIELPMPSRKYQTTRYSLIEASPRTGRFHQIRRHLARIGYPIVGDTSHGDTFCNHQFESEFGIEGLMLHSYAIRFFHPVEKIERYFTCPLRKEMQQICGKFHWFF